MLAQPPSYPLSSALRGGVPATVAREAFAARCIWLHADGNDAAVLLTLRLFDKRYADGGQAEWRAKRHVNGRSLTGYAGRHGTVGEGIVGLSAEGIRRAMVSLDRQERATPKPREARYRCVSCGAKHPYDGSDQQRRDATEAMTLSTAARRYWKDWRERDAG